MFLRQTCVSTSNCPTMCFNVKLSCGEISLLSRGVVRGGCVAGMPPKPSASPICFVSSSHLFCFWRMKICKKTSWLTLLLNWITSSGEGFLWTLNLCHQLANQTSKFIHNAFTKISFQQWPMLYTNLKDRHCRTVHEYNGKYPIMSVIHSINLHCHNT